jgi:hypothetical protein
MTKDTQSAVLISTITTCMALGLLIYMYAEAKTKNTIQTVSYDKEGN